MRSKLFWDVLETLADLCCVEVLEQLNETERVALLIRFAAAVHLQCSLDAQDFREGCFELHMNEAWKVFVVL